MVVAVLLAIDAIALLESGEFSNPTPLALAGAAISIVCKELLYHWTIRVGRRAQSAVVIANAWHHRSDALSSVAVFIGIGAALFDPELRILDPIVTLVVALFILRVAWQVIWGSFKEFTDAAPPAEITERLYRMVREVPGVVDAHALKVRSAGGLYLVQVHVDVDGTLSVTEGHEIADTVGRNAQKHRR